jgi:recombinational DNA repair protein RecT
VVQALLQAPRAKARLEDALHRQAVAGVVAQRVLKRLMDVVGAIGVLEQQDAPGVVTAVAREASLQAR